MRIQIRSGDPRWVRAMQDILTFQGVEARGASGPASLAANAFGEDVTILDARAEAREEAEAIARAVNATPGRPLAILGLAPWREPPEDGGPFDSVLPNDRALDALARQIDRAARFGLARQERRVRSSVIRALGGEPGPPKPASPLRALFAGPPDPFFLALEEGLRAIEGEARAVFTSFSAFDHLHDDPFDALVLNARTQPGPALALCGALRRNADLHHLPAFVLTPPGDRTVEAEALAKGALLAWDGAGSVEEALAWLVAEMARTRRLRAEESALKALTRASANGAGGAYAGNALERYLEAAALGHHTSGRPLGLAALHVAPAPGAREPSASVWRRGFGEAASLAARLTRESDFVATLDDDLIVIVFPNCELNEARASTERVSSVAECTAFALAGEAEAPIVFAQSVVGLHPGESGQALLARALSALERTHKFG